MFKEHSIVSLLNDLPDEGLKRGDVGTTDYEVKVSPANFSNFNIYCQSSSINRKLVREHNF